MALSVHIPISKTPHTHQRTDRWTCVLSQGPGVQKHTQEKIKLKAKSISIPLNAEWMCCLSPNKRPHSDHSIERADGVLEGECWAGQGRQHCTATTPWLIASFHSWLKLQRHPPARSELFFSWMFSYQLRPHQRQFRDERMALPYIHVCKHHSWTKRHF